MAGNKTKLVLSHIESRIFLIRGHKVLLDSDLAELYGVETKRLNEQVRRNLDKFPKDFSFSLVNQEVANLKSQFATSSIYSPHGGRRKPPLVFTEHGAIMAATVLNSPRAVEVSVFVVRAFVKLRELSQAHQALSKKLDDLEQSVSGHDKAIITIIKAIRQLTALPVLPKKHPIGFAPWEDNK